MSPWAQARPCTEPGCPNMQPCATHVRVHREQRKRNRAGRYREGNTTSRGYGGDWQKVRAAYMAAHPYCEQHLTWGEQKRAAECHHIVAITDAPHLRLEPTNLMALCRSCHQRIERTA